MVVFNNRRINVLSVFFVAAPKSRPVYIGLRSTIHLSGSHKNIPHEFHVDTIISCIAFFRSWLRARLSVATKRTRSGHGQAPYWPRMLDWVEVS